MDILTQLRAVSASLTKKPTPPPVKVRKNSKGAALLAAMEAGEVWHTARVAEVFGWDRDCSSAMLSYLAKNGLLTRVGRKTVGCARVTLYVRKEEAK